MKKAAVLLFSISLILVSNLCLVAQTYTGDQLRIKPYGKLVFWYNSTQSDYYQISMERTSDFKYGPVQDYSIKTTMHRSSTALNRGWTWGELGKTPVIAMRTDGTMQIAKDFYALGNIGIGTTSPSKKLHVVGDSYLQGKVFVGSTDTYFYRDAANRIATPDMFYVQSSSPNTYLYSTNTYLGAGSGDNIHLRGNKFDWTSGGGGVITANGDVGIGTTGPSDKLDVNGAVRVRSLSNNNGLTRILAADNNGKLHYRDASSIGIAPTQNSAEISYDNTNSGLLATNLQTAIDKLASTVYWDEIATDEITLASGKVGINTTAIPVGYALAVGGDVIAERVRVSLQTDWWPDYVFEKDYELQSLELTETYINENHHLPNVPSSIEVSEEGIDLGEMDAVLLRKIEELTLHLINQNKKIEELLATVNKLENEN